MGFITLTYLSTSEEHEEIMGELHYLNSEGFLGDAEISSHAVAPTQSLLEIWNEHWEGEASPSDAFCVRVSPTCKDIPLNSIAMKAARVLTEEPKESSTPVDPYVQLINSAPDKPRVPWLLEVSPGDS